MSLDPDNFSSAVNMVRAAADKGDSEKLFAYGDKTSQILQRFKDKPAPEGTKPDDWASQKAQVLQDNRDSINYVQQLLFDGAYRTQDSNKRAALLVRFTQLFPASQYTSQALGVAAASYRQTQHTPKMLEVANGLVVKEPETLGILL